MRITRHGVRLSSCVQPLPSRLRCSGSSRGTSPAHPQDTQPIVSSLFPAAKRLFREKRKGGDWVSFGGVAEEEAEEEDGVRVVAWRW